ncbi:MAG: outer membrane beta-barrel protein [Flavobacteriales bacterium]
MRNILVPFALLAISNASAQFQLNPQLGVTFQNLTEAPQGAEYRANVGFLVGVDGRIGDALYLQPGVFFGRNATTVTYPQPIADPNNPGATITTDIEDNLVRSVLKLRTMLGYKLVNEEQFKLRFAVGPSYDVLLSTDLEDDNINWNEGDFKQGSFNLEAGLGLDIAFLTIEPGVAFGLSRVFEDNPLVGDINSKYFTFYLTAGLVFGKGVN